MWDMIAFDLYLSIYIEKVKNIAIKFNVFNSPLIRFKNHIIDHHCFNISFMCLRCIQWCLRCVEAKKKKVLEHFVWVTWHVLYECYTGLDTSPKGVEAKEKTIFLGHLSESSNMYHTSVEHVSLNPKDFCTSQCVCVYIYNIVL
jgi:hypothetical protein